MSNQELIYLFSPGDGAVLPPYLAGRKREQEFFRDRVRALKNRKPIGQDMIVYGPRGNGKTALLRYLQKETLKKRRVEAGYTMDDTDFAGTSRSIC